MRYLIFCFIIFSAIFSLADIPKTKSLIVEGTLSLSSLTAGESLLLDGSKNVITGSVFPPQSGNSGKYLTTNGTLVSWGTVATSNGTVTNVGLSAPSIFSVTGSPITSSGTLDISLAVQNAAKVFSGPISGGDAIPTFRVLEQSDIPILDPSKIVSGVTNTFVGFNNSGVLEYIPGWSFNSTNAGLASYHSYDFSGSNNFHNIEVATEIPSSLSGYINNLNFDFHFDRNNTGEDITSGGYTGLNISTRHEGSGNIPNLNSINLNSSISGNGGSVGYVSGINATIGLNPGDTIGALNIGNFFLSAYGDITSNATLLSVSSNGTIGADTTYINLYNNAEIDGNFRFGSFGNDKPVSENVFGVSIYQNADVAENYIGYSTILNGDTGTGTSTIVSYDARTQGDTISGTNIAFNMYNESEILGDNSIMGLNAVSVSDGYRFIGAYAQNDGDMSEEIRGFQFTSSGDTRTATGLDIYMSGEATDDVRGIRIDMNSQTSPSTSQHVRSLETNGGVFGVNSSFVPFPSIGVDIGNNFTATATINSGSPLSGSDFFVQFFQSNLLANDSASTGPFGLDINMNGAVSQVGVSSGVYLPQVRGMLLGTSVPLGSGGTIGRHVVLEFLGLPSFGGYVANPYRVGIQDSELLGTNFCNGATECWTYRANDSTADNYFAKSITIGGTLFVSASGIGLEVSGGKHIKYSQPSAPTATPDSNAGTSATCSVIGTDNAGEITLTTGSGSWSSGSQCEIGFSTAFGNSPKCVFSSLNSNSAVASINSYLTVSTTDITMNFVNADTASTEYIWAYQCVETN